MTTLSRRSLLTFGLVAGTGLAVTACSPQSGNSTAPASSTGTAITHVHAITRDAAGTILLATHEGLFRLDDQDLTQVGPVVDLMGFTTTGEGRYLASGHPGLGVDLPEPVGLIESTDAGESWRVIGFDGQLRISADGRNWDTAAIPSAPASLAVAPGTGTVLATTEDGLLRSSDNGTTWTTVDTPQLMSRVAWADDETMVGAGIDGRLLTSRDAGDTWTASRDPVGEVVALGAGLTDGGEVEALLVEGPRVLRSLDGGATTEQLL